MPIYEYQCGKCKAVKNEFRAIDDRNNCPECCNQSMKKIISSNVRPDIEPYVDIHMLGPDRPVYVKSRQHKKQLMKEHNVREKLDYFT